MFGHFKNEDGDLRAIEEKELNMDWSELSYNTTSDTSSPFYNTFNPEDGQTTSNLFRQNMTDSRETSNNALVWTLDPHMFKLGDSKPSNSVATGKYNLNKQVPYTYKTANSSKTVPTTVATHAVVRSYSCPVPLNSDRFFAPTKASASPLTVRHENYFGKHQNNSRSQPRQSGSPAQTFKTLTTPFNAPGNSEFEKYVKDRRRFK